MAEEVRTAVKPHKTADIKTETLLALLATATNREAAKLLGIGERTLYDRIEKYSLREELAKLPEYALQRLQATSIQAANALGEELSNRARKLDAAKEILDRVGLKGAAPTLAVQVNNYGNLTDDQLDQLIEARKNRVTESFGGEGAEDTGQSTEVRQSTPEAEGSNTSDPSS